MAAIGRALSFDDGRISRKVIFINDRTRRSTRHTRGFEYVPDGARRIKYICRSKPGMLISNEIVIPQLDGNRHGLGQAGFQEAESILRLQETYD